MRRVVAGITGVGDDGVLALALDEALRRRLPLDVVHAHQLPAFGDLAPLLAPSAARQRPEERRRVTEALDRALSAAPGGATADVTVHVTDGVPAHVLLEAAQSAALVVLGRRGGGAVVRGLRGSVSAAVLLHTCAPTVLVPPGAGRVADRPSRSRVVVGLDGSPASQTALVWAVAQAVEWGSVLVPVVVLGERGTAPPALTGATTGRHAVAAAVWERVRAAGGDTLEVHLETRRGHVARELLSVPTADDVVVVGSRGRRAGHGLGMGGTSLHVAECSRTPVVVVREGQARRETQRRVAGARAAR